MAQSYDYDERHALAVETFRQFMPDLDPERSAKGMQRNLGALGSFAFDVVGEMWSRPQLSRRDRSLFVIAVLAAQTRDEELQAHTRIGLRHGLTRVEIEEILLHVAAYAGFPAAMAASRRVDAALAAAEGVEKLIARSPAAGKSDAERERDGVAVLHALAPEIAGPGVDVATTVASLEAATGELGVIATRWSAGEIWTRKELSRRDRSMVMIGILTSLGVDGELRGHLRAWRTHGLTQAEIEEVITHISLYVGFPRAINAMRIARQQVQD